MSDRGEEQFRRPTLPTIHTERKSTGPPSQAGKLPATNESIEEAAGVSRDRASFADGDICNPVEVDLVGEIEVGGGAGQVRGKGVCQAASDKTDVLVAIDRKSDA